MAEIHDAGFDETTHLVEEYYAQEGAVAIQDSDGVFWTRDELVKTDDQGTVIGLGDLTRRGTVPVDLWPDPTLVGRPPMATIIQQIDGVWLVVCWGTVYLTSDFTEDSWVCLRRSVNDTACQYYHAQTYITERKHKAYPNGGSESYPPAPFVFLLPVKAGTTNELRFGTLRASWGGFHVGYRPDVVCASFRLVMRGGTDLADTYTSLSAASADSTSALAGVGHVDYTLEDTSVSYEYEWYSGGFMKHQAYVAELDVHVWVFIAWYGQAGPINDPCYAQILTLRAGIPSYVMSPIFPGREEMASSILVKYDIVTLTTENRLRVGAWGYHHVSSEEFERVYEVSLESLVAGYSGYWTIASSWSPPPAGAPSSLMTAALLANDARVLRLSSFSGFGPWVYDFVGDGSAGHLTMGRHGEPQIQRVEVDGVILPIDPLSPHSDTEYGTRLVYADEEDLRQSVYALVHGILYVVNAVEGTVLIDPLAPDFVHSVFCIGTGIMQKRISPDSGDTKYAYIMEI